MHVVVSSHSLDPCLWGGVRSSRFWSTSQFISPSGQQLHHSSGAFHKSRSDSVVRMWVQLKRWCLSCVWVLQRGHSCDGCDLASTLCKYDLTKGDLFVPELGKGATSEARKCLFRADNVWWRCARVFCYCLLWLDA